MQGRVDVIQMLHARIFPEVTLALVMLVILVMVKAVLIVMNALITATPVMLQLHVIIQLEALNVLVLELPKTILNHDILVLLFIQNMK